MILLNHSMKPTTNYLLLLNKIVSLFILTLEIAKLFLK